MNNNSNGSTPKENSDTKVLVKHVFPVEAEDYISAGEASGTIKNMLKQLGVDSKLVRRVAIACYEAELNLVIHSWGGQLTMLVTPHAIRVITEDTGPGIPDVEMAMKEGYSTASEKARELGFGAGMGLPNIQRNASQVEIQSKLGEGTTLKITFEF